MRKKIRVFFLVFITSIAIFDINAMAQECVDSTPFCACVLANGTCFDIDTPIDTHLVYLVIAAMVLGYFKLRSSRPQPNS